MSREGIALGRPHLRFSEILGQYLREFSILDYSSFFNAK
jgi:hypothetical protein